MTRYRLAANSTPRDLADGRVLGPGEEADLDEEAQRHSHNRALIDAGLLLESPEEEVKRG